MALPTTLVSVKFPIQNSYLGPFLSSTGSVYIIITATILVFPPSNANILLQAHKSTNPSTINFAEVDGANRPIVADNIRTLWVFQDGDDLHVAVQEAGLTSNRVSYSVFHMATDLWDATINNEQVDDPNDEVSSHRMLGVSIALRSDGDVIILYAGDRDRIQGVKYERIDYARKEGGTWTFGIQVDAGGKIKHRPGVIVLGADDRMHFFYEEKNGTADNSINGRHRSLDSANNLDTENTYDTALGFRHRHGNGVAYVSGGSKVRVPTIRTTESIHSVKLDSGADPTITFEVASDVDAALVSPAWTFALDGTTIHLLYVENTIPADIRHDENADDAGWGVDDTEPVSGSINRISSNIYTRAGNKVLAYVYEDGANVKYNERNLGVPPPEPPPRLIPGVSIFGGLGQV